MLRLFQEILIEQVPTKSDSTRNKTLYFPAVNNFETESNFEDLTKTAKVTFPRNLKYETKNIYEGESPLVRRGDKITIKAGYYPNLNLIFEGYISKVDNNVPTVLNCEDAMWVLKQKIIKNKTFNKAKLKDIVKYLIDGTEFGAHVLNAYPISIRINEASVATVLKTLSEQGIYSYFIGKKLYVGLAYQSKLAVEKTFLFEKNIIETQLDYLKKEDVKVKVKGVLINGNEREEISVGDEDGDLTTFFLYGSSKDELKRQCEARLEQSNYTGYYGSFTTFLEPKVVSGDYAVIDSYKYPERKGTYLIKSVKTSFGVSGGRQIIELERRLK